MPENKSNKTFLYGMPKYGKSATHVAPVLKKQSKIVLVTCNRIEDELRGMGIPEEYLEIEEIGSIPVMPERVGIDIGKYSVIEKRGRFLDALEELEEKGITKHKEYTIILSRAPYELLVRESFIDRIETWDASVIIECMCYKIDVEGGYYDHIINSEKWNKIAVFDDNGGIYV